MRKRAFSTGYGAWLRSIGLCLLIALCGIILAITPPGRWLEEEIALGWLFNLRGAQTPPSEVVVVSIDQLSSTHLQQPNKPRKWPRALHGQLVRQLAAHGVAVIGFDIIFEEPREAADNAIFAAAVRDAGNVVLFQYLKREIVELGQGESLYVDKLISPIPVLAHSAAALAPFPLPKVPARVNHFVLFKPELGNVATLPVTMLQVYSLRDYDQLYALLQRKVPGQLAELPGDAQQARARGELHLLANTLRRLFLANPGLADQLHLALQEVTADAATRKRLSALIAAYAGAHSQYLNFYGAPHSLRTIPYYQVLDADPELDALDLQGKAVFVGFSEQFQPEQKDGFYTVYTDAYSGLDISGVEIIATAFANLLEQNTLRVPHGGLEILLLLAWSFLLVIVLRMVPGMLQLPLATALALLYGSVSYYVFAKAAYWLPLGIPLLVQAPLATALVLLLSYRGVQRERKKIRHAFGYHLPAKIVDDIARGIAHIGSPGERVQGVVLATDAAQYTRLSEVLAPEALHALMNRYYETLFAPIRKQGGFISDVQGDAALAIWSAGSHARTRRRAACQAALAIRDAVDHFNAAQNTPLPIRMGMHCGEILLGHVGALDHYEYRAVGDVVNTAARLETLNKQLGTRILVSAAVLDGLTDFASRELGRFVLLGKTQAITVYELLGMQRDSCLPQQTHFEEAMRQFRAGAWQLARECFEQYLQAQSGDGPSQFYVKLCTRYLEQPPKNWQGIIELDQK